MGELLVSRAPMFDDRAHPAAYLLTSRGGTTRDVLAAALDIGVPALARGLPLLLPVASSDLDTLLASGEAAACWAEPVEDELDEVTAARWRAAAAELGGLVVRDPAAVPSHQALLDVATAGHIRADGLSLDELRERRLHLRGTTSIVTGVDTTELHRHCRAIGMDLVGGRYLDDVDPVSTTRLEGDRMVLLQLTALLQASDPALDQVTGLVERSPTLSYEVLRWINSAFIGLKHHVDDLRRAVGLLGPGRLTQVVSLLLARDLSDRPEELYRVALVRARMCQGIAEARGLPREPAYIVGLFSMLESLLEQPLEHVLEQLPLPDDVAAALLHHEGRLGLVLQATKLYENGGFDDPALVAFDAGMLSSSYLSAIVFADDVLRHAAGEPESVSA